MSRFFVCFLTLMPSAVMAQRLSQGAIEQIEALMQEKASRTPAQQKLSSHLLDAMRVARLLPQIAGVANLRSGVDVDGAGTVLVDIVATVTKPLLGQIGSLGGDIVNSFPQYDAIRARLPLAILEAVAALPEIRSIRPADRTANDKINTSEGDITHRANLARESFGVDGTGVKVGVISDSVEALASLQASGDLPPSCPVAGSCVKVVPGQAGSGISEGTAMMEIIHDLAPGSKLVFATDAGGQANFANNILALQQRHAKVIVDDGFYFAESVFQDGIIAQAVNTVVAAGVVYLGSAGNSGSVDKGTSGTWEGDFTPGQVFQTGTVHDFGGSECNALTKDTENAIILQWSDPLGGSANDYDLFLFDSGCENVVGQSTFAQNGTQDPIEFIGSQNRDDTGNQLVIVKRTSAAGRFLSLQTIHGQLAINTTGATTGHHAGANTIGVAATDVANSCSPSCGPFVGGPINPVEDFSSDGPRRIFFQPNGTPITPGNFSSTGGQLLNKPDVAAADGVSTPSGPDFEQFFGTSAAAPHAAAIAALLLAKNPGRTPSQVRSVLTTATLDNEGPGIDRDSGAGIVDAQLVLGPNCVGTGDHVLKGNVKTSGLAPIPGVKMKVTGSGCKNRVFTDSSGHYAFTSLADGNYSVTPVKGGCTFTPTSAQVDISGADMKVKFSGDCP